MRKTKIVCTLGPATDRDGILEKLICSGVNVLRCNFSHADHEEHGNRINQVKQLREKHNRPVAILLDTKGPEIRIGVFKDKEIELVEGQEFTLYNADVEGTQEGVSITYKELYEDVHAGSSILIDDGLVEITVKEVKNKDIVCIVKNGAKISNRKGVNVPDIKLSMPFLSDKDKDDIKFGIENDIDFVAASFVRRADDVRKLRKYMDTHGGYEVHIIAKIENREGVKNIDEILECVEGVMVARGDMGVEIPYEEVPVIQKMIIKKAIDTGKHVITATQMLDSMIKNPRPTRAEATDVANAIYDGTSAIMLSGETANGQYPLESFLAMTKIAEFTEGDIDYRKRFFAKERKANPDVTDAICHATVTTALDINASAIVTVTKSGLSARNVSKYMPPCQLISCTMDQKVWRQLNLVWGSVPMLIEKQKDVFELFDVACDIALEHGIISKGDLVVHTSGVPIGVSGTTNMIKVSMIE